MHFAGLSDLGEDPNGADFAIYCNGYVSLQAKPVHKTGFHPGEIALKGVNYFPYGTAGRVNGLLTARQVLHK
jgi:hypothetical protein